MKPGDLVKLKRPAPIYQNMDDFKQRFAISSAFHKEGAWAERDEIGLVLEVHQFQYANNTPYGLVPWVRFADGRMGFVNEMVLDLIQEADGQNR